MIIFSSWEIKKTDNPKVDMTKPPLLCCWNIRIPSIFLHSLLILLATNSWSTFELQKIGFSFNTEIFNLMIYKDVLLVYGSPITQLSLLMMDLNEFELPVPFFKSAEEELFDSLYMNEETSDFSFKVQDQTLPAHKGVLIQKSRYFANLFKSGMIESRQETIEIPDSDIDTFQGLFLLFKYN